MVKYLIRLDDACPGSDWVKWHRLFSLFDKYSIKPIVAVIPDNADSSFCSFPDLDRSEFFANMRRLQDRGYKMAIHGYNHVYTNRNSGLLKITAHSEFSGESYEIQYEKIRKAYEIFQGEGLETDLFVAPSHSFDEVTIACLKKFGIVNIYDGLFAHPYKAYGCRFIPCQLWYPILKSKGIWTICLHPDKISEQQIRDLESFIINYQHLFISYNQCPEASPLRPYDYYVKCFWYIKRCINKMLTLLRQ